MAAENDKKIFRLIDANANRCREGLRVIEDTARFIFEKETVYRDVRELRHLVDRLTRDLYPRLLRERDSASDAGRRLAEGKRDDLGAVLAANFRRAEEALRVLEEYSRLIAPQAGPGFKEIRYKVYEAEKELLAKD
jgi:thiamine-phosphate pyrophosphorylase